MTRELGRLGLVTALCSLLGCSGKPDIIADLTDPDDAGNGDAGGLPDAAGANGTDGAAPITGSVPPSTRDGFCQGRGALIAAPAGSVGASERCTGQVASQLFRYALCTCGDAQLGGSLRTDAFDSSQGAFTPALPAQTGAAVGVNQTLTAVGTLDIGGSLTVAGPAGMSFPGSGLIRGDLRVRGPLHYAGDQSVARNLWLADALDGLGTLHIGGDIHQQVGAGRTLLTMLDTRGKDVRENVQVEAPCACDPAQILDIAAIVDDGRQRNHNAEIGLDPDSVINVLGSRRIELACGRLFVSRIGGVGDLTFVVNGRTALFVGGDVKLAGALKFELGPDGALDLFIGGTIHLVGAQDFGDPRRPARIRFYVASNQQISIAGTTAFVGNLYAPNASVNLAGSEAVFGSIFAGQFSKAGTTVIHYDSSIVREGDACDPPPRCEKCSDCGASSACVGGACGSCRSDADCCVPHVCNNGSCGVLLL